MSNMTQLEKVLATELAKLATIDIPAIIEAAQASIIGGCKTVASENVKVVETVAEKPVKPARTMKEVVEANKAPVVEKPAQEVTQKAAPTKEDYTSPATVSAGVNISGLFSGTGADKKVVKDVFLAAVEQAKTLQALVALNATCDCGFATGDYTEETAPVLKRKLARWGAAQE